MTTMWRRAAGALAVAALLAASPSEAWAQSDDFGIWTSVGAEKSFNKKWSVGAEGDFRTRDNSSKADRWSFGVDGSYKIMKGLKVAAAYTLLYDNNREKTTYHDDGTANNYRPSYWGLRHRFSVSLTGSVNLGDFKLSLRERWQYTYRPEKTVERYDVDNEQWEDKTVRAKGKNVLRSKLKAEYDITRCAIDPYADVEMFNAWALQKVRFTVGAEWKITKRHTAELFYRYQSVNDRDDDNDAGSHILGIGYKYKF